MSNTLKNFSVSYQDRHGSYLRFLKAATALEAAKKVIGNKPIRAIKPPRDEPVIQALYGRPNHSKKKTHRYVHRHLVTVKLSDTPYGESVEHFAYGWKFLAKLDKIANAFENQPPRSFMVLRWSDMGKRPAETVEAKSALAAVEQVIGKPAKEIKDPLKKIALGGRQIGRTALLSRMVMVLPSGEWDAYGRHFLIEDDPFELMSTKKYG